AAQGETAAQEHGVRGHAAQDRGQYQARGGAAIHAESRAAAGRDALHRLRRRHGQHRGRRVPVPRVPAEHRGPGAAALAASAAELAARGGGVVLHSSGRRGERSPVHQALRLLQFRSGGPGSDRGGRSVQGVRRSARRLERGRAVRAVLLFGETPVSRTAGQSDRRTVAPASAAALLAGAVLSVCPTVRLSGQDSSVVDRGVRVGIIYRPGVRPGMVLLPGRPAVLDSARAILARDLDYSDRFEMITLPGGDSIRVSAPAPGPRPTPGARARTGGEAAGLNYSLYQALGADFAIALAGVGDTTQVTAQDVTAGAVRRLLKARLPGVSSPRFRMAVHRLADQIVAATLGTAGTAATRVLFVIDGKLYQIDSDGAGFKEILSAGDREILSPAWDREGRRFAFMEFWSGHGQLLVQDASSGRRRTVTDGTTLDF